MGVLDRGKLAVSPRARKVSPGAGFENVSKNQVGLIRQFGSDGGGQSSIFSPNRQVLARGGM